jgi:hypothetical protein
MRKHIALVVIMLAMVPMAQAASLKSVLANVPDTLFHVVTVATDAAEYVTAKVAQGFAKVDTVADDAVDYFHAIAHPAPANVATPAPSGVIPVAAAR